MLEHDLVCINRQTAADGQELHNTYLPTHHACSPQSRMTKYSIVLSSSFSPYKLCKYSPIIWLKILSKFTSFFFSRYLCITLRTLQREEEMVNTQRTSTIHIPLQNKGLPLNHRHYASWVFPGIPNVVNTQIVNFQ
jgi:hypothetical protein